LLVHDRWFSPGPPASSTTKTGRHDIDEIFLKVALNTINQIKSNQIPENKYDRLYIRQKLWCRSAIVIRHIYFFKRGIQFSSLLSIELVSFIGKFDLHILSYNPHLLSVCLVVLQNTLWKQLSSFRCNILWLSSNWLIL
jgi:hypothetical protein